MTVTLTAQGRLVLGDHHRSYHFTETIDYRVDVTDGRYATGEVINHFTATVNPQRPLTTATSMQKEQATLYNSDGQPVGEITLHFASHKTYSDLDGDGPGPDEIIVAADQMRITCPLSPSPVRAVRSTRAPARGSTSRWAGPTCCPDTIRDPPPAA